MRLCRFEVAGASGVRIGLITSDQTVMDLTETGVHRMKDLLENPDLSAELLRVSGTRAAQYALDAVRLLTPVEAQEVWAAGVTYLRSKQARMVESEFSASALSSAAMPARM